MKETGIIRRVDDLGRVVIPRDIRRFLHLNEGDPMEILVDKGSVTFRRYSPLKINRDICQMAGNALKKLGVSDYAIYDAFDKLYGSAALPANLPEEIRTAQKNLEPCFSESYWIIPVSSGDQIYGYLLVHTQDMNEKEKQKRIGVVRAVAAMIEKYISSGET